MTLADRQQAYLAAPESIQHCYSSRDAAKLNKAIQEKFDLTATQFDSFLEVSGDTILGFYQTKDLPGLLQKEAGLSADTAQHIVASLAEHLTPVLERERMLANPKLGEVKALHQQFSVSGGQPGATAAATVPPPTAEEPESMHNVTPMRTMAGDMNRIHGYGAYRQANPAATTEEPVVRAKPQEEILRNRQPLTGVPNVGE